MQYKQNSVTLRRRNKNFVDISLSFEPNPVTNDISVLRDERAINNSLKNLILIAPKEVPFRWDVGSNVSTYLFELSGNSTEVMLKREIERTIEYNEPRVETIDVNVNFQEDSNDVKVTIIYKIVGYDEIFTVSQILKPTD